ncbi:glycosyltransferase [Acinetobacter wuhouensis]|uniref:glycosyltransferase family 2 protein n=1 Tax=Acinetobacter wuhouensis TaxID=1879050 RepID=UPI00083A91A2|nr:glycosyltransferase [Acinetobacter wuhouensis]AXQ23910.1 glycosyltransferase [Acinetobacter wuhouensis]
MNEIRLSIVVSVYNIENYIAECLSSLNITNDVELILINDGSIDDSLAEIHNKIDMSDLNVRVITQANSGISNVRNLGIELSQGKYIMFIDGDDYVNYKNLMEVLEISEKNNSDVVIGNFVSFRGEDKLEKNNSEIQEYINCNGVDILYNNFLKDITPSVWKGIYNKKFLVTNELFFLKKVAIAEDFDWLFRVLFHANKVSAVNLYFYYYRLRDGSAIRSQFSEEKYKGVLCVVKNLIEFLEENKINELYHYRFNEMIYAILVRGVAMYKGAKNKEEIKMIIRKLPVKNVKIKIIGFILYFSPNLVTKLLNSKYQVG